MRMYDDVTYHNIEWPSYDATWYCIAFFFFFFFLKKMAYYILALLSICVIPSLGGEYTHNNGDDKTNIIRMVPRIWATDRITGEGIKVAVLDTGIGRPAPHDMTVTGRTFLRHHHHHYSTTVPAEAGGEPARPELMAQGCVDPQFQGRILHCINWAGDRSLETTPQHDHKHHSSARDRDLRWQLTKSSQQHTNLADAIPASDAAYDRLEHGSVVASLIAGRGGNSYPGVEYRNIATLSPGDMTEFINKLSTNSTAEPLTSKLRGSKGKLPKNLETCHGIAPDALLYIHRIFTDSQVSPVFYGIR